MKTFCPNCEKETDSEITCEIYYCKECDEDNGNYEKPMYRNLISVVDLLLHDAMQLAEELELEQNSGYKCSQLLEHEKTMELVATMRNNLEV